MIRLAIENAIKDLMMEKEALSYKKFWTGADFARNLEIIDKIVQYEKALTIIKD